MIIANNDGKVNNYGIVLMEYLTLLKQMSLLNDPYVKARIT